MMSNNKHINSHTNTHGWKMVGRRAVIISIERSHNWPLGGVKVALYAFEASSVNSRASGLVIRASESPTGKKKN